MSTRKMTTVKCATQRGLVDRPCVVLPKRLQGALAVAHPAGEDKLWAFIHVSSGHRAGRVQFRSLKNALAALPEVLALADWNAITPETASAYPHLAGAIHAVGLKHGGVDLYGRPLR
jgi:hypothetical protein